MITPIYIHISNNIFILIHIFYGLATLSCHKSCITYYCKSFWGPNYFWKLVMIWIKMQMHNLIFPSCFRSNECLFNRKQRPYNAILEFDDGIWHKKDRKPHKFWTYNFLTFKEHRTKASNHAVQWRCMCQKWHIVNMLQMVFCFNFFARTIELPLFLILLIRKIARNVNFREQ